MRLRRSRTPLTIGALVAIAIGVLVALGAFRTPAPAASPPPATAISTQTPSASPTVVSSPATTLAFENAVLGYRMTLAPSWRRSECLSRIELTDPKHFGQDVLTWRTVAAERDVGVTGGAGAVGAFAWVVTIIVQASEGLTGPQYAERVRGGGGGGEVFQPSEIDGTPAVRVRNGAGFELAYYVARNDRMYTFGFTPSPLARPAVADEATLDAMARSIRFVTPAPRPTPTARPALNAGAEAVVDEIAAAFSAKDADRLRALITPRCWFNSGFSGGGGAAASGDLVADGWRTRFASGLTVRVEPRPIQPDPPMPGAYSVWSTWTEPGQPIGDVQLVIDQVEGRWFLIGALFNARR